MHIPQQCPPLLHKSEVEAGEGVGGRPFRDVICKIVVMTNDRFRRAP
jgi:hypothetical protein